MPSVDQSQRTPYDSLSLSDLVAARDLYHFHLMNHANVVATALGRYRIRVDDSWPTQDSVGRVHGTGARTLQNSEVRPYSWPCVLVFVKEWVDEAKFFAGGGYDPDDFVPKTLYMPDGRKVPVCVIQAPRDLATPTAASS